jgi:5-methyltetrahydropteroyltriglutamate--homocysteine methyltransferase
MPRSTDRILTTHAGSLPRPDDLVELMWAEDEGKAVDPLARRARIATAVQEVVARQQETGIDLVSDGEMSKPGFNIYIPERFSGFAGSGEAEVLDLAPFPRLVERLFASEAAAHTVMPNCVGPVELQDEEAIHRDVANLQAALSGKSAEEAFMGAVSPGQVAFNFANQYYPSHEEYLRAMADALRYEYRVITDAGFSLQIDSPDLAMAAHCHFGDSSARDWRAHLPLAIDALNYALDGIPPEQVRLHVCWGNYAGPHHFDVPLHEILPQVLRANVGAVYVEGANPRHEHEWAVFQDIHLPTNTSIILGVIDVKTNYIEHPRVVANRITRLARIVGRDNVVAATDCGLDTYIRYSVVDPDVAWLKLKSLVEGAALASRELF